MLRRNCGDAELSVSHMRQKLFEICRRMASYAPACYELLAPPCSPPPVEIADVLTEHECLSRQPVKKPIGMGCPQVP